MKDDDLRNQLEALRCEVRALGSVFIDLQQDDLRRVYGDQIRSVLVERIEKFVSQMGEAESLLADDREGYKSSLLDLVDEAISYFKRSGTEEATRFLDEYESNVSKKAVFGLQPGRRTFDMDLIKQMKNYFETSEAIFHQRSLGNGRLVGPSPDASKALLSPIEVEKTLSPLCNSLRIKIMMRLSKENDSLAELSRALGLKKGHLQFHLRSLLESDYIQYDRKSHLYSITARGAVALDGVTKLIQRLASI